MYLNSLSGRDSAGQLEAGTVGDWRALGEEMRHPEAFHLIPKQPQARQGRAAPTGLPQD